MSKRNVVWLVLICTVGLVVGFAVGVWWGVGAAAVVLALSEVVERIARQRRRAGKAPPSADT